MQFERRSEVSARATERASSDPTRTARKFELLIYLGSRTYPSLEPAGFRPTEARRQGFHTSPRELACCSLPLRASGDRRGEEGCRRVVDSEASGARMLSHSLEVEESGARPSTVGETWTDGAVLQRF